MKFVFGPDDFTPSERGESRCWLLCNGLGGYQSTTAAFSVNRCDQGILIAADPAPTGRDTLVHRLSEQLTVGDASFFLSAQNFADGTPPENGTDYLTCFRWEHIPRWDYVCAGVSVRRTCVIAYGKNTAAVRYEVENHTQKPCVLRVTPSFLFGEKGQAMEVCPQPDWSEGQVSLGEKTLYYATDGTVLPAPTPSEHLAYEADRVDGRKEEGMAARCFTVSVEAAPGGTGRLSLVFSTLPTDKKAEELIEQRLRRQTLLTRGTEWDNPVAEQLAESADAFLVQRDSTQGMSVIAGYPLFGDWGRDTMIALPGCCLATGRCEEAKSILRTFLSYERKGLIPNLFPQGDEKPEYNSADAPLLLLNGIWLYFTKTADAAFVREAWPVMERICRCYQKGTMYHIGMAPDGLIFAGAEQEQVTWMDVRVDGILPTPRHGKPVEINALWYNALRIMEQLAPVAGRSGTGYAALARTVRESFARVFWIEEKGCLRDVVSGTDADEQIRCNQIWAVSLPFTMLSEEQERQIVHTVYRYLYTPLGLRTLSPEDREFCPSYGGSRLKRDLAYHQGTVWPFPLGEFYLAWLKVGRGSEESRRQVREMLEPLEAALREGCVGQLPEIYDGLHPAATRGCFAQAWSVGELLRVYEQMQQQERNADKRQADRINRWRTKYVG